MTEGFQPRIPALYLCTAVTVYDADYVNVLASLFRYAYIDKLRWTFTSRIHSIESTIKIYAVQDGKCNISDKSLY